MERTYKDLVPELKESFGDWILSWPTPEKNIYFYKALHEWYWDNYPDPLWFSRKMLTRAVKHIQGGM